MTTPPDTDRWKDASSYEKGYPRSEALDAALRRAEKAEAKLRQWESGNWESERSQNIRHDRDRLRGALERLHPVNGRTPEDDRIIGEVLAALSTPEEDGDE